MTKADETELKVLAILLKEGRIGDPPPDYGDRLKDAVAGVGAGLAWNTKPITKKAAA